MATLAGCGALAYPHTTYLLDDGRRPEMADLAAMAGAEYLAREDNSHAKAGNINAALPRTEGELVLVLDADHVPMPDALNAVVGYFDDPRMAVVQTPHDFFNHDSVQHYRVGRHEQSMFYRVVCPGKDRHGAAYWCGSAALINREALLAIGGVATETIAEDFHTTIRLLRYGWRSALPRRGPGPGPGAARPRRLPAAARPLGARQPRRLHPAGVAAARPHAEPAPAALLPVQPARLPGAADAAAAPADAWRGALDRGAADEDQRRRTGRALAALGGRSTSTAGMALARGYMRIPETAHYELLTMEIYTRALRCIVWPSKTAFKVTPKQGTDGGGWTSLRKLHLVLFCTVLLAGGTLMRMLDLAGVGPLPTCRGSPPGSSSRSA